MIEWGRRDGVHFVHGELTVGEALAPPLIKKVKWTADPDLLTIIDAAPGTACPAVEAVKGADACVLVTEPTPFGLNDLQLAVDLVRGLNIPLGVVVNRCDVGDSRVEDYCRAENIPILAKMPLDRRLAVHYSNGEPIVTHDATWKRTFEALFQKVVGLVSE